MPVACIEKVYLLIPNLPIDKLKVINEALERMQFGRKIFYAAERKSILTGPR
jgi:hypothetical protein